MRPRRFENNMGEAVSICLAHAEKHASGPPAPNLFVLFVSLLTTLYVKLIDLQVIPFLDRATGLAHRRRPTSAPHSGARTTKPQGELNVHGTKHS